VHFQPHQQAEVEVQETIRVTTIPMVWMVALVVVVMLQVVHKTEGLVTKEVILHQKEMMEEQEHQDKVMPPEAEVQEKQERLMVMVMVEMVQHG
jgi:carbon starvation protein CstA